ncbi:hypothetical protein EJF36_09415 [Bacillus sp. HMF5848]|uniref:polysaccharide deacetylase family protein n=1 Tax=Bacillus sp. HMF5848 TaxID=2495421 RepID=UPI000F7777C3|nr:polysaccharide deacetylase family protein [Bacillus sp. HMF5848]RSK27078.1 hypothetical protein EJF36_09415 [Bacillus sp. HMF5848]
MKRVWLQIIAFVSIVLVTFTIVENPYTTDYVYSLKQESIAVNKQKDSLFMEITANASKYEKKAEDAKIDSVWKAMPGINGLKVDIEQSYENMQKDGKFSPDKLVYEQVSPNIHLDDLEPAPIYRGHPEKLAVAFMINVAWGNEYIPSMVDTLKKNNVKATFFLEGQWVKNNPDLAKMIVDAGFEVGNHAYTHPDMKTLTNARIRDEIEKTNAVIEVTTGKVPSLFAPPSGSYRDDVVSIAHEQNLKTILWTVDTIDWQKPTPDVLINRVMSKLQPGALVLMHPTESTAKSLEPLIRLIQSKKLLITDVSTTLSEKRIIK